MPKKSAGVRRAASPSATPSVPLGAMGKETRNAPALPMVVGVGASAGGLEALRTLVAQLSPGMGACYVVAQHLSPTHRSLLTELLARETELPVVEAVDGMEPKPDHIVVAPPSCHIQLRDNALRLTPTVLAGSPKPSVDELFYSLAESCKERCIGIVLSGTGSDGSRGVRAIHAGGGCTLAQDPSSARYDGMPRAAIDSGCVDHVLAVSEMGARLRTLLLMGSLLLPSQLVADPADPADLEQIARIVQQRIGFDLGQYKPTSMERRVRRRMVATDSASLNAYAGLLRSSDEEPQRLVREMFISVTSFFRDPKAFDALEAALSAMVAARLEDQDELRLWVPGCATGEEAFSLAMLVCSVLDRAQRETPVRLFATDVDRAALARARRGVFPAAVMADVPSRFHADYLQLEDEWCTVSKRVRDMVIFSEHNLLRDPAFLRLDLISCRNLLIYLRSGSQERVMNSFAYALKPGGLLLLGRAEAVHAGSAHFAPVDAGQHLYRSRGSAASRQVVQGPGAPAKWGISSSRAIDARSALAHRMHSALMEGLLGPFVLIDDGMRLVQSFGNVAPFLQISPGAPSFDLMQLVIEPLRLEVRSLLFRAQKGKSERLQALVDLPDGVSRVKITVMRLPDEQTPYTLLMFHSETPPQRVDDTAGAPEGLQRHVELLEEQLANTRAHLNAVIGELESSNEELQSLNEELQSANEELQSANEEMETSNEELQSTNEELITVNQELETRGEELSMLNNDLRNVKDSLLNPLIVVDEHRRVMLFNPPAEQLFSFAASSVGGLLFSLPCRVDIAPVSAVLSRVIEQGESVELQIEGATSYLLRVQPYRDSVGNTKGAVLDFRDNTAEILANRVLAQAVEETHQAQRMTAAMIDALPLQVCLVDSNGRILLTNLAWRGASEKCGGSSESCGEGADYIGVCERAAASGDRLAEEFLAGLRSVIDGRESRYTQEYPCETPQGPSWFLATVLRFAGDSKGRVVISHEDITQRKWQAAQIELQANALDHTATGVVIVDASKAELPLVFANAGFESITGWKASDVMGRSLRFLQGGDLPEHDLVPMRHAAVDRQPKRVLLRSYRKDNTPFWNDLSITPIFAGERTTHVVGVIHDVTELMSSQEALQASRARETQALAFAGIGSLELDVRTGLVDLSDQHRMLLGMPRDQRAMALADLRQHVFSEDLPAFDDALRLCITGHGSLDVEFRLLSESGSVHWLHTRGNAMLDDGGMARRVLAMTQDVTARKSAEEHARFIAHHDALTGLPNRTLLRDRLQLALNSARRSRSRMALLFLDLDRFKDVNDSLGHEVGDALLVSVAARLRACVRDSDTVCRQSGDEFIVLLPGIRDANEAAHVADKVLAQVSLPHSALGHTVQLTCSIGIGMYPDDGATADELIRHSDAAMYHAKGSGRNGSHFFSHALDTARSERVEVTNGLRNALVNGQFELHYQPQFDVISRKLIAMEALIRWRHPQRGLIYPDHFIPAAEESSLIDDIGAWVLDRACAQLRQWQDEGMPSVPLAVNVSAFQLRRRAIIETITAALSTHRIEPRWLELELTERAIIYDPQSAGELLSDFRGLGIRLALDDFGTGYSSLSYLHRFPVDKLKIDASFVRSALRDASAAAIVRAVIQLAGSLGIDVVAEGVETPEQLRFLQDQGCASFQGFLASRAMPASDVRGQIDGWLLQGQVH